MNGAVYLVSPEGEFVAVPKAVVGEYLGYLSGWTVYATVAEAMAAVRARAA